ncbi:regulator of G-protein signaling 7-like isoform X2 [Macrosteles quadrilineatus]|uniref:regulator of G-protein signaling 7-like isoform X2 n=1 Tax=Macrosteles quadrilineatus TaxID=74068 RepID=UPI0023E2F138|nr:regulator of G-protein signaling 7-like isoform X2 [Macrosteles quadrilineatus]
MEPADRAHRPLAFDKMEGLVRAMQDPETGVPVRSQKLFLTSIPSAFMGYDLIEWLMERLNIEESEAVHLANQLCQYGYFFPVSDSKNLVVKDDSSLYRFQTPYYWPWQHRSPDNVEYAIYLCKRTLRNKQRHGLEEYETEALGSLKKTLQNKWDFISMQAEEQVRLAKERKKGDKIVSDSQERAYWRIHRPPPGFTSSLEPVPVCNRGGSGSRRRRTSTDVRREVEFLRGCMSRSRMKVSQALEGLMQHCDTYLEYDPLLSGAQPSNPWHSEDTAFWHFNSPIVEVPTEKRVKRWGLSMEDLVSDQTGIQEFTNYLRKEYSHENIRFWMAVRDLRRSSHSQIPLKVQEIYEEFLAPGAPCEINIDGKTMEKTQQEMKNPTRWTFDYAAEHVYTLLLKKDCYPRFIRSDHYKNLLATGVQPSAKKRFFGFGGAGKKKSSTSAAPNLSGLQAAAAAACSQAAVSRRRGSDRSLTGSAHELAVSGITRDRVGHSHSQSNLSDIPYRGDLPQGSWSNLEAVGGGGGSSDEGVEKDKRGDDVCPWDTPGSPDKKLHAVADDTSGSQKLHPVDDTAACSWDSLGHVGSRKNSTQLDSGSSSSDISLAVAVEVSERLRKNCNVQDRFQGRRSSNVCPRPSVSSMEDVTPQRSFDSTSCEANINLPVEVPERIRKKSVSGPPGRKQSTVAPLISVSSVAENPGGMEETEEGEVVSATTGVKQETSQKPPENSSEKPSSTPQEASGKTNDVCPWEDEDSCKVDTPFVKTYVTLDYL